MTREQAEKWVPYFKSIAVGLTPEKLNNLRVCSLHFASTAYLRRGQSRLVWNAVPTLNLPRKCIITTTSSALT